MIVLRIIGRLIIILAMVVLFGGLAIWLFGADVTQATGKAWFESHVASLNFSQVIVQRHLHLPAAWDFIVRHLLTRPVWETIIIVFVVWLVLGGVLIRLGRPPQRRSGFS
jgi:ABC-type uncharacterized transport system permease subunit